MELRYLESFLALSTTLHFGRAADRLYVSQSTLSRQIQQLERELNVALFERAGRRVTLTAAGHILIGHAERVLAELREARLALGGAAELVDGHLTIGCYDGASIYLIPNTLAALHTTHPSVVVSVATVISRDAVRAVRDGDVDAALVVLPAEGDAVDVLPLFHEDLVLTMPAHHPLKTLRRVPIRALLNEPLITSRQGQGIRRIIEEAFKAEGRWPTVAFEFESVQARKDAVRAGLGVTILGKMSVPAAARQTGLLTRPLAPAIRRSVGLVVPGGRPPDPVVASFAQATITTAARLGCEPMEGPAVGSAC